MENEKKYASLTSLQTFLENLKTKFATITHSHTMSDITDYTVDSSLSSTSTNPVQNKVIVEELDDMAEAMAALEATIKDKADSNHDHNDIYYTENEIDNLLTNKSDSTHKHDDLYDAKGSADIALDDAKSYTDDKISNMASNLSVTAKINVHNTSTSAHDDIRDLINELSKTVNNFLNVDDTAKDQLSEVLQLIEDNKGTLDSITLNKINVSDIVNNLTTNDATKVLSAAQGVAIKNLIDVLQEELDNHSHTITANASDDDVVVLTGTNGTDGVTYSASHADSGVIAGTYKSVTVDEKGHVTGGSNPTTISEFGIMDAYTKDEVNAELDKKSNNGHGHSISDVTNLQNSLNDKVPISRTINNKELSSNITLSASDVGADASGSASSALTSAKTYTDEQVATKTQVQMIIWGDND